jgi:integrase
MKMNDYIFPIIMRNDNPFIIREEIKNRLRRYNGNLERIRNLCEIENKLTSYVSLHSWATIAKKSGINVGIISDALGHNDSQVTRVYLESFGHEEIDTINEQVIQ